MFGEMNSAQVAGEWMPPNMAYYAKTCFADPSETDYDGNVSKVIGSWKDLGYNRTFPSMINTTERLANEYGEGSYAGINTILSLINLSLKNT